MGNSFKKERKRNEQKKDSMMSPQCVDPEEDLENMK